MSSPPYMQFYPGDYLADTQHLTTEQHGAYLLLILNYWMRGKPLDNSNDRLTAVTRLSNEKWKEAKPLLQEFFEVDGDTWIHHRLERDLETYRQRIEQASAAGKASAAKRWDSGNGRSTVVNLTVEPKPNQKKREEKKRKEHIKHKYGEFKNVLLADDELSRLFDQYGESKTKKAIEHLSEYIKRTGKASSQDHNLVLRRWVFKAIEEEELKQGNPDNANTGVERTAAYLAEMEQKRIEIENEPVEENPFRHFRERIGGIN